MNAARLKLLGFALLCVALGFAGLSSLSGRTAELAAKQTAERLAWGQTLFEASARLSQAHRSAALAAAAADPSLVQALASGKDPQPSAAAAAAAQKAVTAAFEKVPSALRSWTHLLVGNERAVSAIPSSGEAVQVLDRNALGLTSTPQPGFPVTYASIDGRLYRVAAAAVRSADGTAVGILGTTFLLDDAFAAEQAKDLTMDVTLLGGQSPVSSLPAAQRAKVAAAPDGAVQLEHPRSLGPLGLPIFAGGAPLQVDKSFALDGAPRARAVLTAVSSPLTTLADFQAGAIPGLVAVLALALALALVPFPGEAADARRGERELHELQQSPAFARAFENAAALPSAPAASPAAAALPDIADPHEPSVGPEDFPFGDNPRPAPASLAAEPLESAAAAVPPASSFGADSLFASSSAQSDSPPWSSQSLREEPQPEAPSALAESLFASPDPSEPESALPWPTMSAREQRPVAEAPPEAVPQSFFGSDTSVPLPGPAAELAAVPSQGNGSQKFDLFGPADSAGADFPEKTAVATVPEHLLRAATRWPAPAPSQRDGFAPVPLPAPSSSQAPAQFDPEERHFHDIFQQFLTARSQCKQAADGLTYDKFAAKLRKNKEQLVQKYSCRTVRFQVYVKDGKAALKASPVKD